LLGGAGRGGVGLLIIIQTLGLFRWAGKRERERRGEERKVYYQ